MSAILHVHRDSERDTRYRGIYLSMDGIFVGQLRHGERLEVELNPGLHELIITNTWATKKLRIEVEEDAEFALQVGSLPVPFMWLMMAIANTSPMKVFANLIRVDSLREGAPVRIS